MRGTSMRQPATQRVVEKPKSLARLAAAVARADRPATPAVPASMTDIPVLRWAKSGIPLAEFRANDCDTGMF